MAVRMFSNIKNIHAVPTKFPADTMTKNDLNVLLIIKNIIKRKIKNDKNDIKNISIYLIIHIFIEIFYREN